MSLLNLYVYLNLICETPDEIADTAVFNVQHVHFTRSWENYFPKPDIVHVCVFTIYNSFRLKKLKKKTSKPEHCIRLAYV